MDVKSSVLGTSNEERVRESNDKNTDSRLRIAIIGSGVSGLAAFWSLKNTSHEVHLYESENYFGGHTQTVEWKNLYGKGATNIDIAFTLFNRHTYPNFTAFINHLKLPVHSLRVTFGLSRNNGNFEWSSTSLSTLFTQRRNLFSHRFYRMLWDILRFNYSAASVLSPTYLYPDDTISDYLTRNDYSLAFQNDYLVPLVSSLWVHDPNETLNCIPVIMLVRYLHNHCILNSFGKSLEWLVVAGGAGCYVDAILAGTPPERLHKSTPVMNITSVEGEKLALTFGNGKVELFDRVIMATHAPQALNILGVGATVLERSILGIFRTSPSTVVLHSDISFMPRNRKAWSAYNYHDFTSTFSSDLSPQTPRVSLTAYLNDLPGQDPMLTGPILTTLNPVHLPRSETIQGIFDYEHPILDHHAQVAQIKMERIQGKRNIWFAGAWLGYGFHEDGFRSGVEAARGVEPGIVLPFEVIDWKDGGGMKSWERSRWEAWFSGLLIKAVQGVILGWAWVLWVTLEYK
ncbi:FAD/NAD(P)-binding domain-containing protein [Stipitochalara longipes BDJ]|nr:FAD/NAD(P)-binding domain-containing protein [Stipitochalara longipes BDJ]